MLRSSASATLFIILISASLGALLSVSVGAQASNEERVNLNTATTEELRRLPGIGPTIAARIVEHRKNHGPFKRPQDVVIVRGIHIKLYRRIAHLICV